MTRRHVAPVDPAATIPDHERGGTLPAAGLPVTWSAYWALLEQRGEIIVTDIAEAAVDGSADAIPSACAPDGGVSLMITKAQRAALRARGVDDTQIAEMKPAEAHALLSMPPED